MVNIMSNISSLPIHRRPRYQVYDNISAQMVVQLHSLIRKLLLALDPETEPFFDKQEENHGEVGNNVNEVLFRDEYQEKSGNLCHIHGLTALCLDDIQLLIAESGYAYSLMSVNHPGRTYVGQCRNLRRRIRNHNSGHSSEGTELMRRSQ